VLYIAYLWYNNINNNNNNNYYYYYCCYLMPELVVKSCPSLFAMTNWKTPSQTI
jgi:uncharacterized protein with ParB-like and HNH nuclease domain